MAQLDDPTSVKTYNISMSCDTPDAEIRYESSGSADTVPTDPTESSTLYSSPFGLAVTSAGTQIKARAFKSEYEPSDVVIKTIKPVASITVPMALPDGSVLFYDRGEEYGAYHLNDDGYPARDDDNVDDGSRWSEYWRYLICDKSDLSLPKLWGPYNVSELTTVSNVGFGLAQTDDMVEKYFDNDSYHWKFIKEKRLNTGFNWFMPTISELKLVYDNRASILEMGADDFKLDSYHWSVTEYNDRNAFYIWFSNGTQGNNSKSTTHSCRLIRRI